MARIKVDPARLHAAAQTINPAAGDYRQMYNKLFSDVDGMAAVWQGADNIAFTTQIRGFKDDFDKMAQLMEEYAAFLRTAAESYQQTQDQIVEGAKRLAN